MTLEMLMQAAVVEPQPRAYLISSSNIFLFFFIMLGPLKLLGPYFVQTRELPAKQARAMAWKVFALAVVAILIAGLLGRVLLRNWHIAPPVMQLAAGLIFLLVALQMVLSQYQETDSPQGESVEPQLLRLVFPVTVTPYGVATVIVMMAMSADMQRSFSVLGLAIAVMALNLLAMLFVRPLMRTIGLLPLQILGAVLGILQVGLALQLMVVALAQLGLPLDTGALGPLMPGPR
ncbi:MarC family protein [Lysobacter panacisoli]|uniref:UPF0056 membrane protein n=1 Tax=Lysobacter panacisoli TaxID=1255263 RepID=A0ABP9LAW9_9GAMM|nr:MarC family protein [Lysobacter panacisoli]